MGIGVGCESREVVGVVELELGGKVFGLKKRMGDVEEGVDGGMIEEGCGREIGVADISRRVAQASPYAYKLQDNHQWHDKCPCGTDRTEPFGSGMAQPPKIVPYQQSQQCSPQDNGREGDIGKDIFWIGGIDKVCGIHFRPPITIEHHISGKSQSHEGSNKGVIPNKHPSHREFAEKKGEQHYKDGNGKQIAGSDRIESKSVPQNQKLVTHRSACGIGVIEGHEKHFLGDKQEEQCHIQSQEKKQSLAHIKTITHDPRFYCFRSEKKCC